MQINKQAMTLVVGGVMALAMIGSGLSARAEDGEKEDGKEVKIALSPAQIKASTKTALAAKPGKVGEIEGEIEDGKTLCEVKIEAADGKTYEVTVDVASNKVVSVELDDEEDEDEDED